ncbi:alpha/beta hydrolase, partial [Acinetobacter baumannii]
MNMLVFPLRQSLCILSLFSILITSGCQLVSLKKQTLHTTISNERNSILTQKKLSEASLNVLYMSGMDAKICMQTPETCIADLEKIPQIQGEQFLSTASELYLSKALALSESYDCK